MSLILLQIYSIPVNLPAAADWPIAKKIFWKILVAVN